MSSSVAPRRVLVGLGSNLGDRLANLAFAVRSLPGVVAVAPVVETDPVGPPGQAPYWNTVVRLESVLDPWSLLALAQQLEASAGRVRAQRWGPRTLDVDLLDVEGVELGSEALTLPHPRLWERAFVVVPLAAVAPELVAGRPVPSLGRVRRVVASILPDGRVEPAPPVAPPDGAPGDRS